MNKCKDCLHYEACKETYDILDTTCSGEFDYEEFARSCKNFADRSEWVHLPCKEVYFICDKGTKFATVMSKSITDLYISEIKEIDKSGYCFSAKEKAEKALGEQKNIKSEFYEVRK